MLYIFAFDRDRFFPEKQKESYEAMDKSDKSMKQTVEERTNERRTTTEMVQSHKLRRRM